MNVIDSSGWLEYFADGSNADFFAPALERTLAYPGLPHVRLTKKR